MGIFDLALAAKNKEEFDRLFTEESKKSITATEYRKRIFHNPIGRNFCTKCGMPIEQHVQRSKKNGRKKKKREPGTKPDINLPFIGIDGEGIGRNPHKYILLAAVDEEGVERYLEDLENIPTARALDFILSLPQDRYIFAYAFGYDLTKILQDLEDKDLFLLFRPELRTRTSVRARFLGPKPVKWNGYILNLQGSKFTVSKGDVTITIWDIFKFFQAKFVKALKEWKVGNKDIWKRMGEMKDARNDFEHVSMQKIREYCLEECLCMGQLARKLVDGHESAGLKLESFYGAGSSASAMLKKMNIKDKMAAPPDAMKEAIAQAFFGGRFENSVIGEVNGPVYNHDISSAYPYQTYFLPCLVHATWKHTTKREHLDKAHNALVRYVLRESPRIEHWAPFPHRDKTGNICYPYKSGGGWVWMQEYLAGERGFPDNVVFVEAWLMTENCVCHPFKEIAHYYRERCRIGKEGPGIVMKLGCNSCYGKIAQSVGNGIFNNWAWAGMITSGCRAQLLDMICAHKDRSKCLMVATDGIFTQEEITPPLPRDTETWETKKPLGGWETKVISQNVFIARPGIYFPMNPTVEQLGEVKGRGVGKSVVFDNWKLISDSWNQYGVEQVVKVANVTRFCGAKTSISKRSTSDGDFTYHRADGMGMIKKDETHQTPSYGEWISREVGMSFDPMPKRDRISDDGVHLELRGQDEISFSYKKAGTSQESVEMSKLQDEMSEQPDYDYNEIE